MSAIAIVPAARRLQIDPASLRRWIVRGCPVVRKGRRGPGGSALVDLDTVTAWRGRVNGPAGLPVEEVLRRVADALHLALAEDHADLRAGVSKQDAAALFLVAFERCCKSFGRTFRFDDLPEGIRAVAREL